MLGRTLILKTAAMKPVESLVRKSFLFRPMVKRFIAGDTVEDALAAGNELLTRGFKVSLDYLGENTQSEAEALAAKATYIEMLHKIGQQTLDKNGIEPMNISIKLTQCGLDQGESFAEANFREVLAVAKGYQNFVRVDMEASEYTDRTLNMIEKVSKEFDNTGTVLQSYLYRTPEDIERIISLGLRVRLVKGAYLEPATVAHPEKAKVDEEYVTGAKRLLAAAKYPALATQDEQIIEQMNRWADENGIDKSRFEYQMLYGIRRDLQDALLKAGYNVRIYIPFGDAWYPYFTRRLAERPANMLFIAKSMFKG